MVSEVQEDLHGRWEVGGVFATIALNGKTAPINDVVNAGQNGVMMTSRTLKRLEDSR
jgi:hypothetical protein